MAIQKNVLKLTRMRCFGIESNPFLPNPDLAANGRTLTLKNPALITRELSELAEKMGGKYRFHITSLDPVNPNNAPTEFERTALQSLKNLDVQTANRQYLEYYRIENEKGTDYFRYFSPLFMEESCINCHSSHGYEIGDIRGGISIILPTASVHEAMHQNYVFMFGAGFMTIVLPSLIVSYSVSKIVIKPVQKIERAVKAIEQGDYTTRFARHKNDEIGDLSRTFQRLQEQLRVHTEELQRSEIRLQALLKHSPEAILLVDENDTTVEANENITRIADFKVKEILGLSLDSLIDPAGRLAYSYQPERASEIEHYEATLKCKDQTLKPVEAYVNPEFSIGQDTNVKIIYLRDISERKKIEKYLVESEKMHALGQLSSGIAHEVRNPLFSMRNNLNYLRELNSSHPESPEIYDELERGIERINKTVNAILDYSKPHQLEFRPTDANQVILSALELVETQFRKMNHRIITKLSPDLPKVELDKHRMEQVFINLFTNALSAMDGQGDLTVISERKGNRAKIKVSNTGMGIEREDLQKIFDPFFTRIPQSTGLGLSIAKTIIQQHNGEISVKSELGKGTTFTLTLPLKQL